MALKSGLLKVFSGSSSLLDEQFSSLISGDCFIGAVILLPFQSLMSFCLISPA